ncbi:MAG: hypothetical protein KKF98_12665 [Bacteroidetes bacterium]|nr:hypothetical protein [Bacteroidota bacterium]
MSYQPQIFLLLRFNKNHAMAATHSGNDYSPVYQHLDASGIKYEGLNEGVIGELGEWVQRGDEMNSIVINK